MRMWLSILICLLSVAATPPGPLVSSKRVAAGGCATPSAPTGIGYDGVSDAPNHDVTWTDVGAADGVEIWASIDGGSFAYYANQAATGGGANTAITSGTIGDGHVYIYKVRATNACGTQSAFSGTVTNDVFTDATHYWTVNETILNSRLDSAGSANFAIAAVPSVTGIRGNGVSYTLVGGGCPQLVSSSVSESGDFTFGCWFKLNGTSHSEELGMVGDYDGDGFVRLAMGPNYAGASFSWQEGQAVITNFTSDTSWHLVIGTFSGSTASISLDGGAFITTSGDPPSTRTQFGVTGNAGADVLVGVSDEPFVFARAISQAEVISIFAGGPSAVGTATSPRFK